jgi:HPt (histidine-containing phosphotransfer) domain-containing protein
VEVEEQKDRALKTLAQIKSSIPMEHPKTPFPAPEPKKPVSKEPIISAFADDEEMLALIQMFVDELGEDIGRMRKALAENDLDALATVAHQLKGSSGGYGFPSLTEKAAKVEQFARGAVDPVLLKREVEEFADMCSRARAC